MPNPSDNETTNNLILEISGQARALKNFTAYYSSTSGMNLLGQIPVPSSLLFVGEGEGYLAAWLAAQLCLREGMDAFAWNADEAQKYSKNIYEKHVPFFWFDPPNRMGDSNSIASIPLVTISTNNGVELRESSIHNLPLSPGDSDKKSTFPFINALALAWLLSRSFCGKLDGSEAESLKHLCQRVQLMIDGKDTYLELWQTLLAGTSHWVFVGEGLQQVVARYTSALCASRAKIPALAISPAEYSKSYCALAAPGMAVIVFEEPESEGMGELLQHAARSGATCIHVVDGYPLRLDEPQRNNRITDPALNTILGSISGQLLAVCMMQKYRSLDD